jgi:hypothetical protein
MLRSGLRRLAAAGLLLLMGAGGGGLPVLDATLFHSLTGRSEPFRAHFEATSGCHADGCALRSTAQESRFAPLLPATGLAVRAPEREASGPAYQPVSLASQPLPHLSRAPPAIA